jgi:hypothetical protein
LAVAIGHEAVIADARETWWQGVQQETADELLGGDRHHLLRFLLYPAFPRQALALGTIPVAAGAIDDARVLAVVAPFDGAAQGCGAAVLDGPHQTPLMPGQGMRVPVGGAVLSKDVGQLQAWRGHTGLLTKA